MGAEDTRACSRIRLWPCGVALCYCNNEPSRKGCCQSKCRILATCATGGVHTRMGVQGGCIERVHWQWTSAQTCMCSGAVASCY